MNVPSFLLRGDDRHESQFQKLNEILRYLNASQLHADNGFVRVEETPSGMILSGLRQAAPPPFSGDGHSGYFRVDLVEDSSGEVTVSVVDGSDETDPMAGCAYYKGVKVDCLKEEDIEIEEGFLCLCILEEGNDTYATSYEILPDLPEKPIADDGTAWYPLAEIIGPDEDGGWYARQIHTGGVPGAASSGGTADYNGYFKITDVSDSSGFKIKIADGASGGNSLCMIDDKKFEIAPTTFSIEAAPTTYYIAITYFPAITGYPPSLIRDPDLPAYWNNGSRYFLIGRVITAIVNDKMVISSIEQDFIAGMPVIYTKTYAGQFAVYLEDDETVSVLDLSAPSSGYAGYTDIVGYVPKKTFPLANALGQTILLKGLSNGENYSVEIYLTNETPPSARYQSNQIPLATVNPAGKITQVWTSGSIVFANTYLV